MKFAVGSFNFGVDQKMLQGKPFERRHRDNFVRVCAKMVQEGRLEVRPSQRNVGSDEARESSIQEAEEGPRAACANMMRKVREHTLNRITQ